MACHTPPLLGSLVGGGLPGRKTKTFVLMDIKQTPLDDDPQHGIKDMVNDNLNSKNDSTKKVTDTDIVTLEP